MVIGYKNYWQEASRGRDFGDMTGDALLILGGILLFVNFIYFFFLKLNLKTL